MKIESINLTKLVSQNQIKSNIRRDFLKPLPYDTVSFSGKHEVKQKKIKALEDKLKKQGVDFESCSTEQLFDAMGIRYKADKESGLLILESYKQPKDFTFSDIGIDENKLFEEIIEIKKDANFKNSNITCLGALQRIGGNLYLEDADIETLGQLKRIGGSVDFAFSNLRNLGELQIVGGDANFEYSNIESLGNLHTICGNATFRCSYLHDIGKLQSVGKNIYLTPSILNEDCFKNVNVRGKIY